MIPVSNGYPADIYGESHRLGIHLYQQEVEIVQNWVGRATGRGCAQLPGRSGSWLGAVGRLPALSN
jgi:hypothetical protein